LKDHFLIKTGENWNQFMEQYSSTDASAYIQQNLRPSTAEHLTGITGVTFYMYKLNEVAH
jgi:hypothetical protein